MLSKKPLVDTICGPDMEVYVRDPIFLRIAAYLIGDGFEHVCGAGLAICTGNAYHLHFP